jgi:biotin operon repressor
VTTSTLQQAYRSLHQGELKRARLSRQQAERDERYVQQARAAGASWRTVGEALGIKRQSAWERFQHLPANSSQTTSPRSYSRDEEKVLGRRAEGATWRAVGEALGITRQSAWERFRHLSPPETPDIPEEVLQARDMTPHAFAKWVVEAATKDPQIERWLHTPDRDLGLSTGHYGAMTPSDLLRTDGLRTFLITTEINRRTPITAHRSPALASRRRR